MDKQKERLQKAEQDQGEARKGAFLSSLFFQWPREIRMRRTHRVNH